MNEFGLCERYINGAYCSKDGEYFLLDKPYNEIICYCEIHKRIHSELLVSFKTIYIAITKEQAYKYRVML